MNMKSNEENPVDYNDMVLSDMHVGSGAVYLENTEEKLSMSRFFFILPWATSERNLKTDNDRKREDKLRFDDDGDLVIDRHHERETTELITLVHSMATPLMDVGQQVWRGAFLLSDFILYEQDQFKDKICLELGAGIGMCGVIAGMSSECIFATDTGESILNICQKNMEQNARLLPHGVSSVKVRELNWFESDLESSEFHENYSWTQEDLSLLEGVDVLLAADVIYDDDLTDALFDTILRLATRSKKPFISIFLAVEKRLNFTLEDLDVASPAYNYFLKRLSDLKNQSQSFREMPGKLSFQVQQIDCAFPQYFSYDRVEELELWEIRCDKM